MTGALAVSIVASLITSFVDVGARRIRFWRRFARSEYRLAQAGLSVVYILAGIGGWFLNKHIIVHPPSSEWLANGLISLGMGQAILRVDVSFLEVEGRGPARSLLVEAKSFLFEDIEDAAYTGVIDIVRALPDPGLEQLAYDLTELAVVNKDVPAAAQVEALKTLADAAEEMKTTSHASGRARLIGFAVKTISEKRYVFRF